MWGSRKTTVHLRVERWPGVRQVCPGICPELHHLVLGSRAREEAAREAGRKTGADLRFWFTSY